MKMSAKKLIKITGGTLLSGQCSDLDNLEFDISTDTRTIQGSDLFLPLKGENFDGHDFINIAIEKGCGGYFTEKDIHTGGQEKYKGCVIQIEDALEAYLNIARCARREINPTLVAITGSAGKTSTKEFVYSVLATTYSSHKSAMNYNNEIGLCKTLLSMPENSQYTVIEMGMRGQGEIELLSRYAEPDIAVITNIGTAHIGRLGNIENIAKAKCEITSHLKESGLLLSYDDELVKKNCNWRGETVFYGREYEIVRQEEGLTGFNYKENYYEIPVMGEYNVINTLPAIEIGIRADISHENIRKGLMNYVPVGDRGKIVTLSNGAKLVLDCYNANPDSVMASIASVVKTYKNRKITLVLGDMEELGEQEEALHKKVGKFISELPVHTLVTIGKKAQIIAKAVKNGTINVKSFENKEETGDFLLNNLDSDSVILLKASRAMKLEEIANRINEI